MARRPFAGTADAYVIDSTGKPIPGRDTDGNVVVSGQAYDAPTGGNLITDLQYATGEAISGGTIIPEQDGRLPRFLGPDDGRGELWLDFGAGSFLLLATDLPARVTAIEALGSGGGSSSGGHPPATATVYSSSFRNGRPATDVGNFTWTCTGSADQTAINAAIAAVADSGGGKVQLLGDIFNITGTIQMRTGVWLCGEGQGTQIIATGDFASGMVTLLDESVHATKLSDLTLDGKTRPIPAGIHYVAQSGQIFTSPPSTNPDANHIIDGLFIRQIGNATVAGYGMWMQGGNLRAGKYSNIRIQNASGCGIWVNKSVDSHYTDIEIGSSGSGGPQFAVSDTAPVGHGIYVNGDQNSFLGVKCWYSRGAGFLIRSVRCRFTACEAQDNFSHGFDVRFGKNTIANCHADSNGQAQGADTRGRNGFFLSGDSNTIVACCSYDKAETGTAWWQQYGFQLSSGLTYSRVVGCITYGNELGSVQGTAGTATTIDIQAGSDGK